MIQIIPDRNGKLTQWDIDRYVLITGLVNTENTEVHIASDSDKYGAYVVLPENPSDDSIKAVIPNILLTYAGMIHIYIYQDGTTIYHQYFSVSSREKPDDYIYTPSEVDGYIRIKEEEAKRQAAEVMREAAEAERVAAEADREVAEDEREAAEAERVSAENVRQSNEMSRVNAEYYRVASEASRISAEQTREKNEITRSSNEINRQSNEDERQNSEEDRIEFETARAAAESLRLQNETARTASENERISAETQRTANEAGRISAEAARVEAEANRQGTYQQYGNQIGDLNQLTTTLKANIVAAVNELHRDIDMVMTEQDEDIAAIQSDINEINQLIDYINDIDNEQSQAIVKIQSDTTSLKDKNQSQEEAISEIKQSITNINATDAAQSQQIAQNQKDIDELVQGGAQLTESVSSLVQTVDEGFKQIQTELNGKQPVGNYVTSVNGTTPDKNGNINIDVQTYTAGEGISIDEGAISVTNPMDDAQVSETATWSSAKIISSVSQSFSQSGSIVTCQPVEGSELHVVSEITAVQDGEGDPSPENVRPIVGWDGANLIRCGQTYTADFGETVYGGTLDWATGVLMVNTAYLYISNANISCYGVNEYQQGLTSFYIELKSYDDFLNYSNEGCISNVLNYFVGNNQFTAENVFWIGRPGESIAYIGMTWANVALDIIDTDDNTIAINKLLQYLASNPLQICLQLFNPRTIQLSPQQILAISGLNTVYCDTGDVTVTGYEDPRHTVAQLTSRIAALESAATGI